MSYISGMVSVDYYDEMLSSKRCSCFVLTLVSSSTRTLDLLMTRSRYGYGGLVYAIASNNEQCDPSLSCQTDSATTTSQTTTMVQ